jgi:hypothetical protein
MVNPPNKLRGLPEMRTFWSSSGRRIPAATPVAKRRLFAYMKKAARQAYRQGRKPPPGD